MKVKTFLLFLSLTTALQGCSQTTLQSSSSVKDSTQASFRASQSQGYGGTFLDSLKQKAPTMQEKAEQQAEDLKRSLSNPYDSKGKLIVDLRQMKDDEWCYPLRGAKVISPYGHRGGRRHSGVDIKTKANDSIRAAFDGIVIMSKPYYGYGNCIILAHENGLQTLYSHNSKNFVKEGDYVVVGQVIALTGRTGRASTEHLHFELRVAGTHYNPNLLFDHTTHQLSKHKLQFTKKGGVKVIN